MFGELGHNESEERTGSAWESMEAMVRSMWRIMPWMLVSLADKLYWFLLVGGGKLQELIKMLLEKPMNYELHIDKLNQHLEAHWQNTL